MPRPSDEQIIAQKEAELAKKTEEERRNYYLHEYREDIKVCRQLSKELQATIEPIEGDIHHIRVNGQVLGYNGFAEWKRRRLDQLAKGNVNQKLGFFNV